MEMVQDIVEFLLRVWANEYVQQAKPILIAGLGTMIAVQILRMDNRERMNPPYYPLQIGYRVAGIGALTGVALQWSMDGDTLKDLVKAAICTPIAAWAWHKGLLIITGKLGLEEMHERLKVRHYPGVHNCDYDGDGVDDLTDSDLTLMQKRLKQKFEEHGDA